MLWLGLSWGIGGVVKKQDRSWLALVAFCTTTALVAGLALAILIASATVAFAVGHTLRSEPVLAGNEEPAAPTAAASQEQMDTTTVSGVITDSRCGARHFRNSGKSTAECAQACVQKGASFVLVDGDKSYALDGNKDELARLAGQRVKIEGILQGNTIRVSGVTSQESSGQ